MHPRVSDLCGAAVCRATTNSFPDFEARPSCLMRIVHLARRLKLRLRMVLRSSRRTTTTACPQR